MSIYAQIIDFLVAGLENEAGNPLSGGKVYSYNAGLISSKNTYTVRNKSIDSPNPIPLDVYGRAVVYGDGLYKFIIKDANDNTIKVVDYYDASRGGVPILVDDPDTSGWGTSEGSTEWFNSTDQKRKMWNGTEIVLLG